MSEKEFAVEILEIKSANYHRMKRENVRGRVLQKKVIPLPNDQIESIKTELQKKGYAGKLIDYTELKILHQTYGSQIEEKTFAGQILEISNSQYKHMKKEGNNGVILKSLISKVLPEEIKRIQQELIEQGYRGKLISYVELQNLHQTYGSKMPERDFAVEILRMNYTTYSSFRNSTTKKRSILGNLKKTNIPLEEIERIKAKLQALGYAGRAISYSELQELHTTYGNSIQEKER